MVVAGCSAGPEYRRGCSMYYVVTMYNLQLHFVQIVEIDVLLLYLQSGDLMCIVHTS